MKKPGIVDLRELAKRRLQRLLEPNPEELKKEIEEARQQGYKLICLPGLRIRFRDYSLKAPENADEE